jgi:hypothetical protein
MAAAQFDAVKETTDAFKLLFKGRNWILGAPTVASIFLIVVVLLVVFFLTLGPEFIRQLSNGGSGAQEPTPSAGQIIAFAVAATVGVLFAVAVSIFIQAWTLVAAEPVWRGQDPAWDRGFNRAAAKLLTLFAYTILVGLIAVVSLLVIVGPIIVAFFAIYGPAYILFADKSATEAIGASFRLASENIGPTLILVLAFIVVYIMGFVLQLVFGWIPGLGILVTVGFQWLFSAYIAIGTVRFYEILNAASGEPPFPVVPETTV